MAQTRLNDLIRRVTILCVVMVQVMFPAVSFAEDAPAPSDPVTPESSEQAPAEEQTTEQQITPEQPTASSTGPTEPVGPQEPTGPTDPVGPQQPTGSASTTYTFNNDTGLWENDYYTWDPSTNQTKPKTPQSYSYNPTTGMWDTTEWYYSPEAGKYLENKISTPTNPYAAMLQSAQGGNINGTGPNSNNQINYGGNTTGTFDLFFNASISNKIGQMSRSGNATVQGNTLGGSALTGDALALLNLLNLLQASWGDLGSNDIGLFVANVDGDVTGDLYIDPSQINGGSGSTDIDVNVSADAAINNDIDVDVASGDATVSGNTTGGNATTGNARAVVNLLNLINSAIRSNKSFIGVLNINGNLNGDILLPPDLIKSIIAATGPNSNNQINSNRNTAFDVTIDDTKTIDNDVNASATTGDATVAQNTNAGSATTGNANTNIVLLNLTGKKVVAKNALLVFVNVMGSWVGLIFDAPAGTYAVAATGPNSNNTIDANGNTTLDVDITKQSSIDNDINVTAESGDATITNNTNAGNAKTGDADVGVNVLNMIDSEFDVSDWFGVLFINVFGHWEGSFGVDTAAGNQPVGGQGGGGQAVGVLPALAPSPTAGTFSFVPRATAFAAPSGTSTSEQNGQVAAMTTGSSTNPPAQASHPQPQPVAVAPHANSSAIWVTGISIFTGLLLLGGERVMVFIRSRQFIPYFNKS